MTKTPLRLTLLFLATAVALSAAQQLWTLPLKEDVKWHKLTELGVLLVGTEVGIRCINPDTGTEIWRRDEFKKSTAFNAREISGTPYLICNTYNGFMSTKTTLYLIDYLEGKTVWTSQEFAGQYLGIIPAPAQNMAVLVINAFGTGQPDDLTGVVLVSFDLLTGKEVWRTRFAKSAEVPLHAADSSGMFSPVMDLSGHHEPLIEGDQLYLPYLGIHCVDLKTGTVKWGVPFPAGDKLLKKTNAPLRIDGDVIYGGGGGSLHAVDKNTGAELWSTERKSNFGGLFKARKNALIAQVEPVGDKIFMRFGGQFSNGKLVELRQPLGVVVLDKNTGSVLSDLEAKEGVTNLMVLPEAGVVMFADAYRLIGLDLATAAEKFSVPIEFKRKFGGGEAAQIGLGALGGLTGLAKAALAQNKARLDVPVAVLRRSGHVIVQGKQHLIAFDPVAGAIKWSTYYASPSNTLGLTAMFAVTALQGVVGNAQAAGTTFGSSGYNQGVGTVHGGLDNYNKYMAKRGLSKTTGAEHRTYVLTNVTDGKNKGVGLLGLDLETGDATRKIILGSKEPEYEVDEEADRIFYFKGKDTVIAYQL